MVGAGPVVVVVGAGPVVVVDVEPVVVVIVVVVVEAWVVVSQLIFSGSFKAIFSFLLGIERHFH